MALKYLLDENLSRGPLWQGIVTHNQSSTYPLDVLCVGDPTDLPLGSKDAIIVSWCEREDRVLNSFDKKTLPGILSAHLQAGGHSPGIFLITHGSSIPDIVDHLVLVCYAGDPLVYRDRIEFIP